MARARTIVATVHAHLRHQQRRTTRAPCLSFTQSQRFRRRANHGISFCKGNNATARRHRASRRVGQGAQRVGHEGRLPFGLVRKQVAGKSEQPPGLFRGRGCIRWRVSRGRRSWGSSGPHSLQPRASRRQGASNACQRPARLDAADDGDRDHVIDQRAAGGSTIE